MKYSSSNLPPKYGESIENKTKNRSGFSSGSKNSCSEKPPHWLALESSALEKNVMHLVPLYLALPQIDSQVMSESTSAEKTGKKEAHVIITCFYFY